MPNRVSIVGLLFLWPTWGVAQELDITSPQRLALSPDGKQLAVAYRDKHVRLWDIASGKVMHQLKSERPPMAVLFSRDGKTLFVGEFPDRTDVHKPSRGRVSAWTLGKTPQRKWQTIDLSGGGTALALDPKGDWLVAVGVYANLSFLDVQEGKLRRVWGESGNGIHELTFAPDGKTFATAGQATRLWNAQLDKLSTTAVAPNENWDADECNKLARWVRGSANSVAFTPDGKQIVAGGCYTRESRGRDVDLALLDVATGDATVLRTSVKFVQMVAVSPDGKHIVASTSEKVELWSRADKKLLKELPLGEVRSVAFLPDGQRLALATNFGDHVELWNIKDNQRQRLKP